MKPQPTQPAASQRLLSLDALRGFDMLFIMGFAGLVTALCKLCPGEFSDWMTAQMGHADWNGFFHHDTIFPPFLQLCQPPCHQSHTAYLQKNVSKCIPVHVPHCTVESRYQQRIPVTSKDSMGIRYPQVLAGYHLHHGPVIHNSVDKRHNCQ